MMKRDWLWAVLTVSVLLNVLLAGRAAKTKQAEVVRTDTIVVRDTVRIVEPRLITEHIVRYDTVMITDTIAIEIPITQRVYEDSTYKAWVSGYHPRLDSLHLYRKEVYYPITIKQTYKPKVVVSAGIYGGFGVKGADYGLGISVGVPIWSW